MEGVVVISVIITIFLLIMGVLAILMPIFVLRIQTEIISTNKKLTAVNQSLVMLIEATERRQAPPVKKTASNPPAQKTTQGENKKSVYVIDE